MRKSKREAEERAPCARCNATGRVGFKLGVTWWDDCPDCLGEGYAPKDGIKENKTVRFLILTVGAALAFGFLYQILVDGEIPWAE